MFKIDDFNVDFIIMKVQKFFILVFLLLIICCDMSTPPMVKEEHTVTAGRNMEEVITDTEEFTLSLFLRTGESDQWKITEYGSGITLPDLFSPIRFTNSTVCLGESGVWDVPLFIQLFERLELYSTVSNTTAEYRCTVTLKSDNATSIHYSLNGSNYQKYSEPVETSTPVTVTVNAETENYTPVRYLSASVGYSVNVLN